MFKRYSFLIAILLLFSSRAIAQCPQPAGLIYNANFQQIKFGGSGVTVSNMVGNGKSVNDIVLYQNVLTIGCQSFDAIVYTEDLHRVSSFSEYDFSSSSIPTEQFAPRFNFSSGSDAYAKFKFQFILSGTYNNSTKTGTKVTFQNVKINSYDIDGFSSSKQYNEFGGFLTYELGNPTRIVPSYNSSTNLRYF